MKKRAACSAAGIKDFPLMQRLTMAELISVCEQQKQCF
jgi:hypothetical protein